MNKLEINDSLCKIIEANTETVNAHHKLKKILNVMISVGKTLIEKR